VAGIKGVPSAFDAATEVLSVIRGMKTSAQKGQRWGVSSLKVSAKQSDLETLSTVLDDVVRAGSVAEGGTKLITVEETTQSKFVVDVVLAEG
jgi:hypothetical protein